jgi:lipopolysaccharide export system protein LptC
MRAGGPVPAITARSGQEIAGPPPRAPRPRSRSQGYDGGDHHSRRVGLLKRLLPILGLMLLTLVAIWPRLDPLLESVRLGVPVIDLRDARELRMLNPRYAGIDRFDRPFVVTAAVGRQIPSRDDLMSLERPKAEMAVHGGAVIVVTAATAVYQSQPQLLDLFGDVTLLHENGTRFVTKTAHVDVASSTGEGHDPVVGHGPSGDIAAQGFRILDKGDTVIFTGKSDLLLKGSRPSAKPATPPPGLPSEVEAAAAQIEAAAAPLQESGPDDPAAEPFTADQPPAPMRGDESSSAPARAAGAGTAPVGRSTGKPDAG